MNTKARFVLILTLALLSGAALWVTLIQAAPGNAPLTPGGSPTVVSYQGQVTMDGSPYDGTGYFKLAVVDADGTTTYWSNDGSSGGGGEPEYGVSLHVDNGLFNVLLGDDSLENMVPLEADVFEDTQRYLRVWFSSDGGTFVQLSPDRRIAAVPYALQAQEAQYAANADTVDGEHANAFANATHSHPPGDISPQGAGSSLDADTVDGLHASELETHYQNVVVVAKSGGDYTSVQAAIDSITDETGDNAYLVWVAPGVYEEQVTMKPYVHLQGAGQEATVIHSTASSVDWPPTQATLLLASDASLRDLTVGNSGTGTHNVALMATAGVTHALAMDVTARAQGGGTHNDAIVLRGIGVSVTLQQVTALGENGSTTNRGLNNNNGAAAVLHGGAFTGRAGTYAYGIYNADSDSTLEAESVTALGENGSNVNYGLYNDAAAATLRGGSFTGRGGTIARGIHNVGSGTTLGAESVTALGENGNDNYGLRNSNGAAATLRGGSFTGREGTDAYGINNDGSGATLEAESVTALAEDGSGDNYGLYNNVAAATLRGGSFTGRGGTIARGIHNVGSGATLGVESVTALGEDGSENYDLLNYGAAATLRGSSFTGRGGTDAYGIYNDGSDTRLEVESVTALGENGSVANYGLRNSNGAAATLRGGSFIGRGGTSAYGIVNLSGTTTLEADSVTALGENGSGKNNGLHNYNSAAATLRGGSFTGRGGTDSWGIYNYSLDLFSTMLEAESVTALGEDGSSTNYGLHNTTPFATTNITQSVLEGADQSVLRNGGTVNVSNSRLVGGAVSGSVTCVLVTRGTTISTDGSTCP